MAGTTTNYGWTYPTSTDYVKDGATAIQTVATGIDTTLGTALNNKLHAGLVLVKTQTIGSAVSSVTVSNAFSATYDNYKIIISGGTANTTEDLNFKLGASTSDYYSSLLYVNYGSTTPAGSSTNPGNIFSWAGSATPNGIYLHNDVFTPFATKYTRWSNPMGVGNTWGGIVSGMHKSATSYTDFTITTPASLTGGTIYVYGYAKD